MRHFYEVFLASGEDWSKSTVVMNARQRSGKKKFGRYVWKKFETLVQETLGLKLFTCLLQHLVNSGS